MDEKGIWYHSWFNSPYYHLLYNNRDDKEAHIFIDNLVTFLNPLKDTSFLDLACGKGRHSRYLNSKGFEVTGIDLSEESIQYASQFQNENLHFYVHDMRRVFRVNYFDYVLNLFTSFGYFETPHHDEQVLQSVHSALKRGGTFVLDFMNANYVINHLVAEEEKKVEGCRFSIKRRQSEGYILKDISFDAEGHTNHFQEKVKAYTYVELSRMVTNAKLSITGTFGDYSLAPFNEKESKRLILICKKEK